MAILSFLASGAVAAPQVSDTTLHVSELAKLPFDELFNVEVTSVSRRPEKLSAAASAIQVLTADDIRRSGATHLADALRLAANVEVQQINSYGWVVSTRGFNALFANKLLVMIDGRTVYTPLHAGVFWDAQSVLLEDIDRIEIISGPGGALWGSNAVNGVINIVTKSARATQGGYVSGAGGSFLKGLGAGRFGGAIGPRTFYRVYAQHFDRAGTRLPNGDESETSWTMTQSGFRIDRHLSSSNTFTLQGDAYRGREFNSPTGPSTLDGQNIVWHWAHTFGPGSALDLRLYADRTWRRDLPSTISDQLETYDADLQHRLPIGDRQDVIWGAGYRLMKDDAPSSTWFVGFVPVRRTMQLSSFFLQDEVVIVPDRLDLTIGSKLEHQEFAGWQLQPSMRVNWRVSEQQAAWAAVSRALRAPSRIDVDYHIPITPPYAIAGGPDFHSEKLVAYELGYRAQPVRTLSLSLATYYNHYDDLYSVELEDPAVALPYTIQNGAAGQSFGAELSGIYQPTEWWRVRGGYTWARKDLWSQPGHDVLNSVLASLGNDPAGQALLQSVLDWRGHWQADATVRYVGRLPDPHVPSYIAVDARLAWTARHFEVSVTGQNLFDRAHPEFYTSQQVPRSGYGRITTRW